MKHQRETARILRFGDFQVDLCAGELRKHGVRIRLQVQPLKVLAMLLERSGEVVTREELHQALWPSDTFVDFDHGLNNAIKRLREALNDSAETPRFVETLARRGYRFIAPAEDASPTSQQATAQTAATGQDARASPELAPGTPTVASPLATSRRQTWWLAALGVAGLLAILLASNVGAWRQRVFARLRPAHVQSIAVLPLLNLSGDPQQEYFADGITDALITDLAQISALRVISRTSVMRYKEARKPLPEIARELNVDAVVEGTVTVSGGRVRITAQLIHAPTDRHLWAKSYERDMRDILALQDDVARAIADEVKVKLTPQERALLASARPVNPEAHEAYLKGRYYSNKRTEKELKKSIEYFQQAIEKDPKYALAYSGLADAYTLLGFQGGLPSKEALSRTKAAALKAVELDETLAEAHASLAFIAETREWDWPTAEREFKRALELNPGYAPAHNWYAGYLMYLGRFEEGIAEAKRARELDPLSLAINNALGGRLFLAGRDNEAIEQFHKTLEMDPNFAPAHNLLGWAYLRKGMHEEAIAEFQKEITLSGSDPDLSMDLGYAYAVVGKREEAKRILAKLKRKRERGFVSPAALAIVSGALGEKDEAFAWLEKAYEERDPHMTYLKVGPRFAPLRSDPRFAELLRRVGLTP